MPPPSKLLSLEPAESKLLSFPNILLDPLLNLLATVRLSLAKSRYRLPLFSTESLGALPYSVSKVLNAKN